MHLIQRFVVFKKWYQPQNTLASLYSILMYQIKFAPPPSAIRLLIFQEFFWRVWAMTSIKKVLQLSPPTPPITGFHQVCCFTSNTLSTFFGSDLTDYYKNNAFSFLPTYHWSGLILLFCIYVFLRALFQSSVTNKLRISSFMHPIGLSSSHVI